MLEKCIGQKLSMIFPHYDSGCARTAIPEEILAVCC